MAAQGYREVVVTGVQISHYRSEGQTLYDLATALLEETTIPRIRLTSLAPWAFDRRLLDLLAHPRVCRHVHMSLQSGCDRTLDRMRRPYTAADYRALVEEIRSTVPGVAVTTDVIVGFPGETEEDHEESRRFVLEVGFSRTHVFSYSPRPGTEAAELPGQADPPTIKARAASMLEVASVGERRFRERHVGETLQVLWEDEREGRLLGTSDNYLRVAASTPARGPARSLTGEVTEARIVGLVEPGSEADVHGAVLVGAVLAPDDSRRVGAAVAP
jgi:threonylcarbamoyladenosine tRNA methylthiotransferase MtaB